MRAWYCYDCVAQTEPCETCLLKEQVAALKVQVADLTARLKEADKWDRRNIL